MDKSNIIRFINNEKQKLYDIQTGLTTEQQIQYNPQIREILMLLDILKNQKLNPSVIKQIKDKIKEATKQMEQSSKQQNMNRAKNYSVLSNVKSNIDSVPVEVRQKAQMAKASGVAHDKDNFTDAQDYLDQMEVPYKIDQELSNQDSLVLVGEESGDIKVAYRGTKYKNLEDIKGNASIAFGSDEGSPQYNRAMEQINKVKTKYKVLPDELVGFSKGSAIGLRMGEKFGIDTTSFNPFLGKGLIGSIGNSKNTIYRTATDFASMGVALKGSNPNYDIKVIDAVKDSISPLKAHSLDNFIDSKNVRYNSDEMLKAAAKVQQKAAKHGEAETIADMASYIENSKPIKVSKDLYNTRAKIATLDPANPHLGHDIKAPGIYKVGEQVERKSVFEKPTPDPIDPPGMSLEPRDIGMFKMEDETFVKSGLQDTSIITKDTDAKSVSKEDAKPISDKDKERIKREEAERIERIKRERAERDASDAYQEDLRKYQERQSAKLQKQRPLPEPPRISKDPLGDEIRARERNMFFDENVTVPKMPKKTVTFADQQPRISKDPLGDEIRAREKNIFLDSTSTTPDLDAQLDDITAFTKDIFKDGKIKPTKGVIQRPLPKPPPRKLPETPTQSTETSKKPKFSLFDEDLELGTGADEFSKDEMEVYDGLVDKNNPDANFTEFIHNFNSQKGVDTVVDSVTGKVKLNSSRMHNGAIHKKMWDEMTDGDFTQEEKDHFDNTTDHGDYEFNLSEEERKKLYDATPEEREEIIKDYEQDALDAQQQFDTLSGVDSQDGSEMRTINNEYGIAAKNFATNLGVGLVAQYAADKAVDFVDPDHEIPEDARLGTSGFLGGGLGEAAILKLGGSALTGAALLPAAVGGAVGNIVGSETGTLVKKLGGTEVEQDVASGATGVGSAVYTTGVIAAGIASLTGAEEGATIGSIFLPGVGTAIGLGVGALLGLGAYGVAKGWDKFKSLF